MPDDPDISSIIDSILRRSSSSWRDADLPIEEFERNFSSIGWRLMSSSHTLAASEQAALAAAGLVNPELLDTLCLARISLLIRALRRLPETEHAAFVDSLFRCGNNQEREALIRALAVLPSPERFVATAQESCRAAVQTTFEAIACDNAYPCRHFAPEAFRAMVLKALHLGIPVRKIHGLAARNDPELKRMATDYRDELEAAGRAIASDIAFILEMEEPA